MGAVLQGKHIVVGLSGGIAAFKTPLLVRQLVSAGAEVRCVATPNALQFVTPLTLETVSNNKVYSDVFACGNDHTTEHIALKDWADAIVVAPATANLIGKMVAGIADDALTTLLVACWEKPRLVCPAMNEQMWSNPITQHNVDLLRSQGVAIVGPEHGHLACGVSGTGRMVEPGTIVKHLYKALLPQDFAGRHVLVTAGPTYEKIDAVRFIGNYSSGKMGFALAEVLALRGAKVTLVAGPTSLETPLMDVRRIDVESASEMYEACVATFPSCQAAILSAAVADFRPQEAVDHKIKKQDDTQGLTLQLVQTRDILATLGSTKEAGQCLVGFALETDNVEDNARKKLARKNMDFVVVNSPSKDGTGFGYDTNKVTIIDKVGEVFQFPLQSKFDTAFDIVSHMASLMTL